MEMLSRVVQSFQNSEGPRTLLLPMQIPPDSKQPREWYRLQTTDYRLQRGARQSDKSPSYASTQYDLRLSISCERNSALCHFQLPLQPSSSPRMPYCSREEVGRNHTPDLNFWRQGQTFRNGSIKAKCTSNEGHEHREHHRQYCPHQFAKLRCSPDICHGKTRHPCA